jgi:hypothetical protein
MNSAWEVTAGSSPTTRSASRRGPGAGQSHLATTNSGRSRPLGRDLQGCMTPGSRVGEAGSGLLRWVARLWGALSIGEGECSVGGWSW